MKIMKAFKYKLLPTKKQTAILSDWAGACRFVYNCGPEHRTLHWKQYQNSISYLDQQNALPEIKKTEDFEWPKALPSQSIQCALRNLDRAFKNFWKGLGKYPQFKKRGIHDSIHFPTPGKFNIRAVTNKKALVTIPKLGDLKFRSHRSTVGIVRNATVTRDGKDWYISFCCEVEHEAAVNVGSEIGIDKGIAHSIATSDGIFVDLPTIKIKKIEKRIEVVQRRRAKQKKYSPKWRKYTAITGKLHRRITRMRHHFLHQTSNDLTKNHSLVVVEDLKVRNMSRSASGTLENPGKNVAAKSGLNRSILRQGWGTLQIFLEYKANWNGSYIHRVNPQNTSRQCSNCLCVKADNRKTQECFVCQECGHIENADTNAAKNILRLGRESLGLGPLEAPTITATAF